MKIKSVSGAALLVLSGLPASYVEAEPAPVPNYCGPTICLLTVGREDVRVRADYSERDGSAAYVVDVGNRSVRISTRRLEGECHGDRSFEHPSPSRPMTSTQLKLPAQTRCVEVELSRDPSDSDDAALLVGNLWAVDTTPVSGWERGYALRLGGRVDVASGP